MCIRDSHWQRAADGDLDLLGALLADEQVILLAHIVHDRLCLLYTSDAADERSSVDLGGRRIIKKKKRYKDTNPPQHTPEITLHTLIYARHQETQ